MIRTHIFGFSRFLSIRLRWLHPKGHIFSSSSSQFFAIFPMIVEFDCYFSSLSLNSRFWGKTLPFPICVTQCLVVWTPLLLQWAVCQKSTCDEIFRLNFHECGGGGGGDQHTFLCIDMCTYEHTWIVTGANVVDWMGWDWVLCILCQKFQAASHIGRIIYYLNISYSCSIQGTHFDSSSFHTWMHDILRTPNHLMQKHERTLYKYFFLFFSVMGWGTLTS